MPKKQRSKPPHFSNGHSKSKVSFKADVPNFSTKNNAKSTKAPAKVVSCETENMVERTSMNKGDLAQSNKTMLSTAGTAKKRKHLSTNPASGGAKEKRNAVKPMNVLPAKRRKNDIESESNSDAESYLDKFFDDIADNATNEENVDPYSEDSDQEESEYYDEDSDDMEEGEECGEAMPLDVLVNYYGKRLDVREKTQPKKTVGKKSPNVTGKVRLSKSSSTGWTVEDNDRELKYETADSDGDWPKSTKHKNPEMKNQQKTDLQKQVNARTQVDYSEERRSGVGNARWPGFLENETCIQNAKRHGFIYDSSDELNVSSSSYEGVSDESSDDYLESESESNSEVWTGESEDEYFDTEDDDCDTDSEFSEDGGLAYLYKTYDSDSNDEDYEPSEEEQGIVDLHIPRGSAQIYDIDNDFIQFNEGISQIIELPADFQEDEMKSTTDASADTDASACPTLVPIYNERGEFVDCIGKFNAEPESPANLATDTAAKADISSKKGPKTFEQVEQGTEQEESTLSVSIKKKDSENDEKEAEVSEEEVEQSSFYHFFDAIDRRMSLAVLKQKIYFYGHVSVQALFGGVEIMGYRFETAETRTVNAVRGYNAVNLTPLPSPEAFNKAAFEKILLKLKTHFIDADLSELIGSFDPAESVLLLLEANSTDRAALPVICKLLHEYNLFPTTNTLPGKSGHRRTEHLLEVELFTATPTRPVPLFQNDPAWDVLQLKPSSRWCVVGGKGAGKSTLCQFLINRFIKQFGRILLIDLDIGQPLLYLPETISASVVEHPLLGVGCFAEVQPLRCQLFGSLNVVSSPLVYIQNVRTLVQHCQAAPELKNVPWIVNTMGYVSGFGEELTAAIVRLVQPTDLIQLTIPKRVKNAQNYRHLLTDKHVNGFRFNILQEVVGHPNQLQPLSYQCHSFGVTFEQQGCPLHPPKRRTLSIMTQLVKILNDTSEWFTDMKPFCAPLDELQILITRDEYTPTKDMLPSILNAMMVYLCEPLENAQYNCLGVGIVRVVDSDNNVHLLHYLPPEQLAKAKVLALCNTSLPSQIYLWLNTKMDGTIPYLHNVA